MKTQMQDTIRALLVRNKVQEIAWDASFMLVLLAREDGADFELIEPEPDGGGVDADLAEGYHARGLVFAGVFALVAGKPKTELVFELSDTTRALAADEFSRRWLRSMTHPRWACPVARGCN